MTVAESTGALKHNRQLLRAGMLGILLLGFGLRTHRLDGQSFWSDEGISLLRSSLPPGEMLAQMPVEHVPGYFVLLAGWLRMTGADDFGVRFLSVWPSMLAVALIFRFAVDLGAHNAQLTTPNRLPPAIGSVAALLLATSSFQIWYAQEARMYSWLFLAGLASTWLLWRMLALQERHPWLIASGYGLAVTLSVYLHFYGFLIPLAHAVFVAGWLLLTRDWRPVVRWALCGGVVFLLFLPWLPRALAVTGFDGWRHPGDPAAVPWRFLREFTAGPTMPPAWSPWITGLYGVLAVIGVAVWWRLRRSGAALLVTVLLVPLAAVLAYTLRNPDYHERYAIALAAPLLMLAAGGIMGLSPRAWRPGSPARAVRHALVTWALPVLATLVLIGANGVALYRHYTDPTLHKPDFRGAAWRIQQEEGPDDVILVDGPDPEKVFLHYYTGGNPVHDLRFLDGADWEAVDAALRPATAGHEDAWELLYFHAPGPVQVWLAVNGWASAPSDHNDIRVIRYGLPGPPLTEKVLNLDVGDALTLKRAEVSAAPLQAGDLLRVSTHWFTRSRAPETKFSLRLLDVDGSVALARDYVPQNGFAPTNVWIVDQPATDRRGVIIPPDLPPGTYTVTLRLYDPVTGAAVETAAGQDIPLGQVTVAP